jgi:Ca2+/Na+ antiporter
VSNPFGSNTFNLMVGLGLPWLQYISSNGFEPYHGLRNESIVESILILAGVLAVFVVLMIQTNFVILKKHGLLFSGMYITSYFLLPLVRCIWQLSQCCQIDHGITDGYNERICCVNFDV